MAERQIGVVEYHLRQLEKNRTIISINHRSQKLYFDISWEESVGELKALINHLRKKISRQILLLLTQRPEFQNKSMKELANEIKKSPSNLHWHIKRLIEDELIIPQRRGRSIILKLNVTPELISRLGEEIYPTRWDKFLDDIDTKFGR